VTTARIPRFWTGRPQSGHDPITVGATRSRQGLPNRCQPIDQHSAVRQDLSSVRCTPNFRIAGDTPESLETAFDLCFLHSPAASRCGKTMMAMSTECMTESGKHGEEHCADPLATFILRFRQRGEPYILDRRQTAQTFVNE
jgi:hypothetical protein